MYIILKADPIGKGLIAASNKVSPFDSDINPILDKLRKDNPTEMYFVGYITEWEDSIDQVRDLMDYWVDLREDPDWKDEDGKDPNYR